MGAIVKWVTHFLVQAEEFSADSQNHDRFANSNDSMIQIFLGNLLNFHPAYIVMELDNVWGPKVLSHIDNYGEVFAKNLGENTPIGLPRGQNGLWTESGLQYSPPFR